jgi:phage terminase large subunit
MQRAQHISLPWNWKPRPDQMELWLYLERGGLRADMVAHRRWGKDDVSLHWTARAAHQRVGVYWHMLPEANQARKAIWDAVNPKTGKRRIDEAFPIELRAATREDAMFIKFKNGSTWQVIGSDNYNSLVGSPPIGVVFSEWALAKPEAWAYIRPILLENGGWATFIWTPRGRNHATRAFEARAKDPNWFAKKMPAAQRIGADDSTDFEMVTPVFTKDQLVAELKEMIDEAGSVEEGTAKFNQEYLVDFDAPVPGSYYGTQLQKLITAGRYGLFPYDKRYKVSTSWDLGIDDYTAIWFWQRISINRVHAVDYYETGDVGLDTIWAEALAPKMDWDFDMHYLPHDVMMRELGAGGRSRKLTLHSMGVRPIRIGSPRNDVERVNAVRRLLPYVYINEATCETGMDHLKQYRKKWNQSMGLFGGPQHDEHSHAADAAGEFAFNARLPKNTPPADNPNPPDLKTLRVPLKRSITRPIRSWKEM